MIMTFLRFILFCFLAVVLGACDFSRPITPTEPTPTEPGKPPVPGFTVAVNQFLVTVTDTSVNATSVSYDWGDGSSDPFASGTHRYTESGSFTIVQTVSNEHGSDSTSRTVTVGDAEPPPVAAFEIVNIEGLTVSFRDRSTGAVAWEWDFGDGERDTIRSPNHTFLAAGRYVVILTVTNASGDTDSTDQTIELQDPPVAGFSSTVDKLKVTVIDSSSGADDVSYDWDDGSSDTFRSGTHIYAAAGTFQIRQRVTNSAGFDETFRTVTVAP